MQCKIVIDNSKEAIDKCLDLAELHYKEVEQRASTTAFNPNRNTIYTIATSGMLVNVMALIDEEVVGYVSLLVSEDFMTSTIVSREIGLFIREDCRGGTTFYRMLKMAELEAEKLGAATQYISFKVGHDFGLAERLGYAPTETTYEKGRKN